MGSFLQFAGVRIRVGSRSPGLLIIITAFVLLAMFVVGILCLIAPNVVLKQRIGMGMDFVGDFIADIAERASPKNQTKAVRFMGFFAALIPAIVGLGVHSMFFAEPNYDDLSPEEVEEIFMSMTSEEFDEAAREEEAMEERDRARAALAASPTPTAEVRIDAMIAEASTQWRAGNPEGALAQARAALALCNEHLGAGHAKTGQVQRMIDAAAKATAAR